MKPSPIPSLYDLQQLKRKMALKAYKLECQRAQGNLSLNAYEVEMLVFLKTIGIADLDCLKRHMSCPKCFLKSCIQVMLNYGYVEKFHTSYCLTSKGKMLAESIITENNQLLISEPTFQWDELYIPEDFC